MKRLGVLLCNLEAKLQARGAGEGLGIFGAIVAPQLQGGALRHGFAPGHPGDAPRHFKLPLNRGMVCKSSTSRSCKQIDFDSIVSAATILPPEPWGFFHLCWIESSDIQGRFLTSALCRHRPSASTKMRQPSISRRHSFTTSSRFRNLPVIQTPSRRQPDFGCLTASVSEGD